MIQKFLGPKTIIIISALICLFVTTNIHWGKDKWQNIIEADARGYYAYLPATFIYHDLNFAFYDSVEKVKYNTPFNYEYRASVEGGKMVDKYFCGTAVAQLPFFLAAHLISYISSNETDGYSRIYMLFITLAAIFYLFIGLWFLEKLLGLYNIKQGSRSLTIITILFGTNLYFYSVGEMGMSHVYSFAFISMFCYFIKKLFITSRLQHLFISMLLLGMIFLIRPVNLMIILAVPFLAGGTYPFFKVANSIKKNIPLFLSGLAAMILIMMIQPLIYMISTGHCWVDSYPGENFNFNDPHFLDILFSYKKGLFLYTPAYLLSLCGVYFFYKKRKFEFFSMIIFFIAITFILASWWNWWYGGSFSGRPFVEYLPLFAVLLAVSLQEVSKKIFRFCYLPLIIILIGLCQLQTYQYRYYIIHWENMNKEKYWNVFLKMDK